MKISAAIFDLDGTLVDNMAFHLRAWQETAKALGVAVTDALFQREFAGRKNEEIFPRLLGRAVSANELRGLAEQKESRYRELYRPQVSPMPGAVALLDALASRKVKLAIASAAPAQNREMVLQALDWGNRFDAVVGGEGLRGKPWPDIFVAASQALGVAPESCLAFEDAVQGVIAAHRAGMRVAGILSTAPAEVLRQAGASWTATEFTKLPDDLRAILF